MSFIRSRASAVSAHVAEQLVARDAGQALRAALLEAVPEVAVGQLHDDDELAVDDVEAFEREDERMADGLDALEGLEFLLGALAVLAGGVEVAVDELDGLEQAAGGLGFPDFAEAAAAQPLDQPVAGDRFGLGFDANGHTMNPWIIPEGIPQGLRAFLRRNMMKL